MTNGTNDKSHQRAKTDLYPEQEQAFRNTPLTIEDERFHPPVDPDDASSSETSYFGFNIPDQHINAEIYHWFHPVSRLCSGGLWIWQGVKPLMLQAEYFNYQVFTPMPEMDLDDWVSPIGIQQTVLEPGQHIQVEFWDKQQNTGFKIDQTAVMPAAVRADNKHLSQALKVGGELTLRGKSYAIDSYFTRDRSWQQLRPETVHPIPPLTWGAAVFDDNLAFHFSGFDDPELGPDWRDAYPPQHIGQALRWGYVYRDGQTLPLVKMHKLTQRDVDGVSPLSATIELQDSSGQSYALSAELQARIPGPAWFNMQVIFCQMKYTLPDGRVGYGDFQDCQFPHYVRQFAKW